MATDARVVADSISERGVRVTTMVVTFWRAVLAEFNTHRTFSRNSASSRAIPVRKLLESITGDPFVPIYWGKTQKGMQAGAELSDAEIALAKDVWYQAAADAAVWAGRLLELGLHKQVVNRLLEPFMPHTVIVTATEWSNFFALRANEDAQPEIRAAAEAMRAVLTQSKPTLLREGEWHLPLIQPDERDGTFEHTEEARRISAARCARVSYLTHEGKRDLRADLTLYERLVLGGHMSPLEHVATPFTEEDWQLRDRQAWIIRQFGHEHGWPEHKVDRHLEAIEFAGNFRGWIQLRKEVPGESDFSLIG